MKIFYLITELDVGGAERSLYELVTRLDTREFEPVVGCLTGHGPIGKRLERSGIRVVYFGMRGFWDMPALFRVRATLKSEAPSVLHTFLFHANLAGRLAAVALGIPRIIASIRVEEPRRRHLWAERMTHPLVDVFTCVSESTRRYMHKFAHIPFEKLVTAPNGIDLECSDAPAATTPAAWRLDDDAPVVAVIGRLDRQKDPIMMIRAAALVAREVPEVIFAFAGTGPLDGACRDEAGKLGLTQRIRWLGWLEDIKPFLSRVDILALSSRWEGMPNVVLEAMACRKPVVATAVGGCTELVAEGETGHLVPRGDERLMAQRLIELLRNGKLRKRFGQAARARVEQHYSMADMVAANEALYRPPRSS